MRRIAVSVDRLIRVTLFLMTFCASAQWINQTNYLKAGWNAVYLHVDAGHADLDTLMTNATAVDEIWMWVPATGTEQFVTSPQTPTSTSTQWSTWKRSLGATSTLKRLTPNTAYYVHVTDSNKDYKWVVLGKAAAPRYRWASSGLNFIGFTTPNTSPTYEKFFAPASGLLEGSEIYRSTGGAFGTTNPARLSDYAKTSVARGEAVWMKVGSGYNRYFGPFEISMAGSEGVNFGENSTQMSFRLRNLASYTNTIRVRMITSETPPAGQTAIVGAPPILVRGNLISSTLTYDYQQLVATTETSDDGDRIVNWTLPPKGTPGSDVQVVIGLMRGSMTGDSGSFHAAVLQFTDSAGLLRVDLPVTATKTSTTGLWVGDAKVSKVVQYLKTLELGANGKPVIKLTGSNGGYSIASTNELIGGVPREFPLRLIVHEGTTKTYLLQRVFLGPNAQSNTVVTTQQKYLDPVKLDQARRISTVHLPWSSENTPWDMTRTTTNLSVVVDLNYNNTAVNPFIHQYHPDHDNLNASFTQTLPIGNESYGVSRTITLSPQSAGFDFASLTTGSQQRTGVYEETITISGTAGNSRTFKVIGSYLLNRISEIATLTKP